MNRSSNTSSHSWKNKKSTLWLPKSYDKPYFLTRKKDNKHTLLIRVLGNLESRLGVKGFLPNVNTQKYIESFLYTEYKNYLDKATSSNIHGVAQGAFGSLISNYLLDKNKLLVMYVERLSVSYKRDSKSNSKVKPIDSFLSDILSFIDKDFLRTRCIHTFLMILTYNTTINPSTEDEKDSWTKNQTNLLESSIPLGKDVLRRYLVDLRTSKYSDIDNMPSFSSWVLEWKAANSSYASILDDDSFYSILGAKLIEILEATEMLKKTLKRKALKESFWILEIQEASLINVIQKHKIFAIPTSLPMIVKPKPFGENLQGSYLLNDIEYVEDIFIEKKGHSVTSKLDPINKIYHMINNVSQTPFKINTTLLDFIQNNDKYNLLLDPNADTPFENVAKRTKYQETQYRGYNSKVVLQETILEIVNFFKNINEIYFPVRLDQRGRLYTGPNYFNYQSNQLSRALLLFAKPGIITRADLSSIGYLKA